ncbi:MAG: DUF5924 family protein [Longimicrobiales bacterium]|nr:DUF5924 family protein [Longimicrobiales bacterium]
MIQGAREFWARHRRLFWILHSGWALATGVAVVLLARERYGFVPWVVGFLVLTWASTLFFGGRVSGEGARRDAGDDAGAEGEEDPGSEPGPGDFRGAAEAPPGVAEEVTSYATRTLYQETLFFLLPLYWHSTVVGTPNLVFLLFLGGLALLSCIDLVFDRWLRTRPTFGFLFFGTVAFAAINLLLPLLVPISPRVATPVAAGLAVVTAIPLAFRAPMKTRWGRVWPGVFAVGIVGLPLAFPALLPPVPLRTERALFTTSIDRQSLEVSDTLGAVASGSELGGDLYVVFEVFAPSNVPSRVRLVWSRDGAEIRRSRDVEIVAHDWGFRVWDGWHPESGRIPPGSYVVGIQTGEGRDFGQVKISITAS